VRWLAGGGSSAGRSSTELLDCSMKTMNEPVCRPAADGLAWVVGWADSWTNAGLWPGKFPLLFISVSFFFFCIYFLCCFSYLTFKFVLQILNLGVLLKQN
jgi:hypothetical protein